ncbi:hypothetical protein HNR65_001834 [Desulfosalsimonas propionicica]|uniref:Uncharacterized protein n=1 Tax=Desulfosalsimonas propionicica TaxID=332175 RepID=A0A7W0HKR8_9BACT|nr:hypothetical protein [Desulfosalsimonas propionicica]MBA2881507.1 hypothetical protein [Desulfosalsimonas propionicica]
MKKIQELWNQAVDENGSTMSKLMAINPGTARHNHVRARWKKHSDLEAWQQLIAKAIKSDFLNGR